MEYVVSFLMGGLICAVVQIFLDKTKLMPGRIMVGLVVFGCLLGAFGLYRKLIDFAGAGASVLLISFGNSLTEGVKAAVDENGFIGIFMGGFEAAATGISAALIFGYIASIVFKPKMKE